MEQEREWMVPGAAIAVSAAFLAVSLKLVTGYSSHPSGMTSLQVTIAIVTFAALFRFLRHLYRLWQTGVAHPIAHLQSDLRPALRSFWPIAGGVAILGVFLHSITFLKSMIPAVVPFWADAAFAASDKAIFVDPSAIAIALKPALVSLGLFYGLWHAVNLGGILWVLHWRRASKSRHILSYMLTWSIGMALAYAFSSMGPLFTGQYDLSLAPDSVRNAAEMLWANYQAKGALIGGGISAFPSLHVAIATWFALVLKDRGMPIIGGVYALAVFACSVILGWHYVIDGVAGAAIAILADRLSRRWMRSASIQQGIAIATATGASTA